MGFCKFVRWGLFLLEGDPVLSDLLPNKKDEIELCRKYSEVDAWEVFGGEVYYFIPQNPLWLGIEMKVMNWETHRP